MKYETLQEIKKGIFSDERIQKILSKVKKETKIGVYSKGTRTELDSSTQGGIIEGEVLGLIVNNKEAEAFIAQNIKVDSSKKDRNDVTEILIHQIITHLEGNKD